GAVRMGGPAGGGARARAGAAAHRGARLRLRVAPRRARGAAPHRAADAGRVRGDGAGERPPAGGRVSARRTRAGAVLATAGAAAGATLGAVLLRRRVRPGIARAVLESRRERGAAMARLVLRVGGRYAARSPQLVFASVERRRELRNDLALRTADEVAEELGSMKGALMKLGQMASYLDDGMPESFRTTMARLQHDAPPMSAELAAAMVREELGDAPGRAFARWDPLPFAAASIGQVHRAITHAGRAVAVQVQVPGSGRS